MSEQLEPLWSDIRAELRAQAPDFKFHMWLDPLELAGVDGTTVYVRAPDHIRSWVADRYVGLLREAARRCFDPRASVEIVSEAWSPPEPREPVSGGEEGPAALNPRYTFDQFVIGCDNRFAHAAALAVAELPAQAYNPLFIHGPPGLGKTHLLHAIGNYISRYGAGLAVRYATIEEFTSAFVHAVRSEGTREFKEAYRGPDVLLIDDVQFLARKDRTREEFFHTLNARSIAGRQTVLTSDRPPEELPELEDRLSERFRSGLVVGVDPPGEQVRGAILKKRACLDDVDVSPEVLDEIAACVTTSIRALEGALIRVVAYASLEDKPATPALARHVLRRLGEAPPPTCGITEIVDAAAMEFGVAREALLARNRQPVVASARQVAMYLARELTDHSLPEIGRGIGGRNHTTVLHAVNRVSSALREDAALAQSVEQLRRRLVRSA